MTNKVLFSMLLAALSCGASAAIANDYPTKERVEYVLGCARDAGDQSYGSIYKCSCVIDAIAERLPYDEYVQLSTATNAFSIGGERGETMRAYVDGRKMRKDFRAIQAEAKKACLMN